MSGQKLITGYLKPKRNVLDNGLNMAITSNPPNKRVKKIENEECENMETTLNRSSENDTLTSTCKTLTKDQQLRSENNRLEAKLKSLCKQQPILHSSFGKTWFKALEKEFTKPYFKKLNDFVVSERAKGQIFPPEDQVWTWTSCAVDSVKVVIIGQDPYHNPGQAHGLCFSVPGNIPPPPSLLNIYKELSSDIQGFQVPKHGNLIGWSRQGVLLLNSVLTVKSFNANSHKDRGWEELTTAVIKYLNEHKEGLIFLLWGAYAQNKASVINKKKHHLLTSVHPSPLSAHRGFFGCQHFSRCNELLSEQGKTTIDWADLPAA